MYTFVDKGVILDFRKFFFIGELNKKEMIIKIFNLLHNHPLFQRMNIYKLPKFFIGSENTVKE